MNTLRSIQTKLLGITVACVLATLCAATVTNGYLFYQQYSRALQANALIVARTLQNQLERMLHLGIFLGELEGFDTQCREAVATYSGIEYAHVVDDKGKIVFSNIKDSRGLPAPRASQRFAADQTAPYLLRDSLNGQYFQAITPVRDALGNRVGSIMVGVPYDAIRNQTSRLALYSMATGLGFLSLALLWLLWLLKRLVTQPLGKLLKAMRNMSRSPVPEAARLEDLPNDEIGVIGHAFNDMLDALRDTHAALEQDIARRKIAEEQLAHLAHYDSLTGLPNRAFFLDYMERRLSEARRHQRCIALMFLDLDGFKLINDTFGHPAGDFLLVQIAKRLDANKRFEDMVARLGGDEFVVAIEGLKVKSEITVIAEKVIAVFNEPLLIEEHEVIPTTSIGISLFPEHGLDLATLMKYADTAMYQAKAAGKNTYKVYSEGMRVSGWGKKIRSYR